MPTTANDLVAAARSRIREVSPREAPAWPAGSAVIIDVREPEEFASGHLPGAMNLPRGVLEFRIHAHPAVACTTSAEPANPGRPLRLYCLTGGRSALAADNLRQLGFGNVHPLAGGFDAWRNEALPTTRE